MHQRTSTQHSVRIDHTHKHKMLRYTDVELKHLSVLPVPVLLCLLFGMDGGADVSHSSAAFTLVTFVLGVAVNLISKLKTADRNKNTERSSAVYSLQGCSASCILLIFSEHKDTFLLFLFIIRTTNSSRSLNIFKFIYPVFVSLLCLIVKSKWC